MKPPSPHLPLVYDPRLRRLARDPADYPWRRRVAAVFAVASTVAAFYLALVGCWEFRE